MYCFIKKMNKNYIIIKKINGNLFNLYEDCDSSIVTLDALLDILAKKYKFVIK